MLKNLKIALAAATLVGFTGAAFADGGTPLPSDRYLHLERSVQERALDGRPAVTSTFVQPAPVSAAELTSGGF